MPKRAYKLSENGSVAIPYGIAGYIISWLEKSGLKKRKNSFGQESVTI